MKKHKHEALIKEWLDNGMPKVEVKALSNINGWQTVDFPSWFPNDEYRLVYPPKPKKQIKMLCWYKDGYSLSWSDEYSINSYTAENWKRVPSEDKIIEVEE